MNRYAALGGLLSIVFAPGWAIQEGKTAYRLSSPCMQDKESFLKIPTKLAEGGGAQVVTHPKVYRWKVIENYISATTESDKGFSLIYMIKKSEHLIGYVRGWPDGADKQFFFSIDLTQMMVNKKYDAMLSLLREIAYARNPEYKINFIN